MSRKSAAAGALSPYLMAGSAPPPSFVHLESEMLLNIIAFKSLLALHFHDVRRVPWSIKWRETVNFWRGRKHLVRHPFQRR